MRGLALLVVAAISSGGQRPVGTAGRSVTFSDTAVLRGVVYDSLGAKPVPLAGADVQLVGADQALATTRFTIHSDSSGAFVLRGVPAGRYVIGFYHPAVDTLGIEVRDRIVDITKDTTSVALGTPSAQTIVDTFCRASDPAVATAGRPLPKKALIIGHVRDVRTESAVEDGRVTATWAEAEVTATDVRVIDREASAQIRKSGWFALCGIPGNLALSVVADRGSDSSGAIEVRVPPGGLTHLTLALGASASRGGRVVGHVVDMARRPVASARVGLSGSDREILTTSVGEFSLDKLPTGTQSFSVRAIGYAPKTVVVQVRDDAPTEAEITLERTVALPAVVVRDSIQSAHLGEFLKDKRSDASGAQFVEPTKLEGYEQQQTVCQLIVGIVRILPCVGPRGGGLVCSGLLINGKGTRIEATDIDPVDIVGVEVLTHPLMSKYGEEIRFMKICPIVVWTRCPGSVIPTCSGGSPSHAKPSKPEWFDSVRQQ